MMGLSVLGTFFVYLLLSIWLIKYAVKSARERGISGWKFGLPMALVMYHLVFWDWIPTEIAHDYYCETEAGFWVYKTVDEWKAENPGVLGTLKRSLEPFKGKTIGDTQISWRTQRFYVEIIHKNIFLSVNLKEKKFYDYSTGALLAYSKNYSKGRGGGSPFSWRFTQ